MHKVVELNDYRGNKEAKSQAIKLVTESVMHIDTANFILAYLSDQVMLHDNIKKCMEACEILNEVLDSVREMVEKL